MNDATSPLQREFQVPLLGLTLLLRPVEQADFEALYACASDPLIWEQHPQSTRYQRDVFQGFFDGAIASKGALVVIERASGDVIGSSRYYDFDESRSQVTIGYTFLARRFWGGAVNREMKGLMLRHAFQFVEHVHFEIGANNRRSRRAIEKLGATLVDEQTLDGNAHVVYRIDKSSYAPA
ncbi:GCN5-related N-acetyltransferase [Labilithrix luteola]|uniref:GCN5-related N-acetyltransferase n=1 Tax=Labilithrix luteola TaxID=1391654 RepID=A0A0K1QFD8_9BACT|nr:GNAT family N-acetyltransferase [Labilithrix luteola]AKV04438.1 GCN5-related N-acetyltransferase [Labilithrix luteola]